MFRSNDIIGNRDIFYNHTHNKYFHIMCKNSLLHGLEPGILRSLHNGNDTII
jgi:hypothetical protein